MSMWPRPLLWPTTTVPCWPGVIKLRSSEVSWFWGCGMLKFLKNYFFKETCAIMPSTRGFGFKNRNFGGFSPGKEVPKTLFGLRWPRLLHNLRFFANKLPLKKEERQRICIVEETSAPGAKKWGYPAAALEKHGCVSYPVASTLNAASVRPDF